MANMCAQYAPTTKLVDGTNVSATHAPIGSYVDETPSSPASTKNEVMVIVIIKSKITLPSNCDLPFNFSGVNTTLRVRAATQPTNAIVYPVSTTKFHGPLTMSGKTLCENQFAVARSNISVDSIKNPQNIST